MTDRTAPHTHWPTQFAPAFDQTRTIYKLVDLTNRYMLGYMQTDAPLEVGNIIPFKHGSVGVDLVLQVIELLPTHTSDVQSTEGAPMIMAYVKPE